MAVEAKRGCGYRKVGGLYMVSGGAAVSCGGLPIPLEICACCGAGIKPSRGFTWIDAKELFKSHRYLLSQGGSQLCDRWTEDRCVNCPVGNVERLNERDGLLWIGDAFYSVDKFMAEAREQGISRRISAIPKGFECGKHWVFLAHRKAMTRPAKADGSGLDMFEDVPGVFSAFRPARLEKIVTESEFRDDDEMAALRKRGITPVVVPDDDPDHQ